MRSLVYSSFHHKGLTLRRHCFVLAVALCFGGHRSTSSSKVSLSSSKAWLSSECPPWCTLHFIIKNAGAQMFAAPTALQFRVPGGQKAVNGVHGSLGSTQHNLHLSLIAFALCLGLLFFLAFNFAYSLPRALNIKPSYLENNKNFRFFFDFSGSQHQKLKIFIGSLHQKSNTKID